MWKPSGILIFLRVSLTASAFGPVCGIVGQSIGAVIWKPSRVSNASADATTGNASAVVKANAAAILCFILSSLFTTASARSECYTRIDPTYFLVITQRH